jgi:ABC-type glycerol-3-phosphate transport system substrate-binding protein
VNADTPNKDAAFTFLAWWTGKDAQRTLALGSGFPPARTDLADDPEIVADPVVSAFAAQVPYAKILLSGVVPFADITGDVWEPAIGRFTRGESVADVMTSAAQQMDSILGCS